MTESTANHWPTELLIEIGNDIATREDLEELTTEELIEFAKTCEMGDLAPEECIPCYAYQMVLHRMEDTLTPDVPEYEPSPTAKDHDILGTKCIKCGMPAADIEPDSDCTGVFVINDAAAPEALTQEKPPWAQENRHNDPLQEFARSVGYLNDLVQEMVSGPPIPPREVTLDELAVLVVAAQRWIKITEAQGIELAPTQQTLLDATKALVARLHHG